jgi:TetR/AcrR family transcriptional regulator
MAEMPDSPEPGSPTAAPGRRRPPPGERRVQILQMLATMLEAPGAERVTTAALAQRLGVSEAALYRHFASKAQMYEALIEFIEQSIFGLVAQIAQRGSPPQEQAAQIVSVVLRFAEKNPGMARVMAGDALVLEHQRLQQRMTLFFDKLEAQLRQCARSAAEADAQPAPTAAAQIRAGVLLAFAMGRVQRYVRSGFRRSPTEALAESLLLML